MFWLTRFCHHKHSWETVLTSRRKYLILWPLTWLETVMIFPQKILFFVTTNRVGKWRHIPSKISCFGVSNMAGKSSDFWSKTSCFVATDKTENCPPFSLKHKSFCRAYDTAETVPVSRQKNDVFATNSAGKCPDFSFKYLVLWPLTHLESVYDFCHKYSVFRCQHGEKISRGLDKNSWLCSRSRSWKISWRPVKNRQLFCH